jgi:glycosyltransferase involved in cell wall biosynthesis
MTLEKERYREVEDKYIPKFDRILVCSEHDRQLIFRRFSHPQVFIIPNIVSLPSSINVNSEKTGFILLFVGSLNYYPNHDGIKHFCRAIFPRIANRTKLDLQVEIIGPGLDRKTSKQLLSNPKIKYLGYVSDLAHHYQKADVVIVPLRAGSGTRIKILEAFSYKKAVISTSIGVEGIDAVNESHILIADTNQEFVESCIRLIVDPVLRTHLGENAFSLVKEKYTRDSLEKIFRFL